jgi:hypothetical protein
MTTEDRLRDAFAAITELVQPEQQPVEHAVRSRRGVRRVRRYGPLAVAAAVLLFVVAGVLVRRDRPPAPGPLGGGPARYFVANVTGGDGINELTVRDVRTGRITATRKPPAGGEWARVSATADPAVFYVAIPSSPDSAYLYRLRIDGTGRISALTRVRHLSVTASASTLAVSPDGTRVAYPAHRLTPRGPAEIDVMTLSDGRRTAFRSTEPGVVDALSWAADGRHLAFELYGSAYSVRVLDTRAGRDLLASSHPVLVKDKSAARTYTHPVLGADGQSLYLIADHRAHGHRSTQLLELDARTGRALRVLYEQPTSGARAPHWAFTSLARDPRGTGLLVVDPQGRAHRVDLASGQVTTIPFQRGTPNTTAW